VALASCMGARCGPPPPPPARAFEGAPVREVASIVAGEVSVVPEARLPVACTALRDWREGVTLARWYGRAEPGPEDLEAVELAQSGECWRYPRFRLVGNGGDWRTWTRMGYVDGDPPWTWERGGWIVVATP